MTVQTQRCENCRNWIYQQGAAAGQCGAKSPVLDDKSPMGLWPGTMAEQWCAEWKPIVPSEASYLTPRQADRMAPAK